MYQPERYSMLLPGRSYKITTFYPTKGVAPTTETGILIRATSKEVELRDDKKQLTGKFETRGDVCVYKNSTPGVYHTTIGLGLFGIEEIE